MSHTVAERRSDGVLIWQKSIGADFWRTQNTLAQIVCELMSIGAVAFAGPVGDNGAGGRGEGDERILIALHRHVFAAHVFLFAADIGPQFVELYEKKIVERFGGQQEFEFIEPPPSEMKEAAN